MPLPPPRYVVLANPDNVRWQAFEPELRAYWRERGAEPDVTLVPWREVVPRDGCLDELPAFDRPALVRLESPGRDWQVACQLLQAGCRETGEEGSWLDLPYEKGRLVRPGLFYAGFVRVLRGLRASFDARPHLRLTACPLEVAEMFDKNATCARLARAGIPIPATLTDVPDSVGGLLDTIRARRFATAYVKLNTGSSASAIAVVRALDEPARGVTSMVRLNGGFYSTRRLQHYSGADLEAVLGFLLREGACVQQGIRMAQIEGQNFDVRVVMVHGQPRFTIFRLSSNPMTNLHLGGRRGDVTACRAQIPTRAWLDGLDHCVETARLYPGSDMMGIDLLFESGYMRHHILEVNAFGDFFPNLVDAEGKSVHRVEIEEQEKRREEQ